MAYHVHVKPVQFGSVLPKRSQFFSRPPTSITYEICRPLIILGKVFGYLSWNFSLLCLNQMNVNFWSKLVCLLYKAAAAIGIFYILFQYAESYLSKKHSTQITKIVANVNPCAQIAFVIFVYMFCLFEENRFSRMLHAFQGTDGLIDRKIRERKFVFKHCFFQSVLTLMTWVALVVRAILLFGNTHFKPGVYSVGVLVFISTEFFVSMFFIVTANLCAESFSSLNSKLKAVLFLDVPNLKQYCKELRFGYKQLYDLAAIVENTFKWLITFVLALHTVFLCLFSYMVLNMKHFDAKDSAYLLCLLTYTYRLFAITTAANNISVQAKIGLEYLHDVQRDTLTRSEEFQIILLSNKLSQSPVEIISAGRLFTLNTATFTTIIGTIITYLIVLMQFRPPDSQCSLLGNTSHLNATN